MENEGSHRRCVIALWIREKRKSREEEREGGEERDERTEKIETDRRKRVSERGGNEEERHIGDVKRKEAEPAERLGRFILDQLHFQPSSEYKRQFNYRGIFKGGLRSPSRLSPSCLSVFTSASLHPLSLSLSTVGISLRSMTTRELDTDTRAHAVVPADTHRTYVHIVRRYNIS